MVSVLEVKFMAGQGGISMMHSLFIIWLGITLFRFDSCSNAQDTSSATSFGKPATSSCCRDNTTQTLSTIGPDDVTAILRGVVLRSQWLDVFVIYDQPNEPLFRAVVSSLSALHVGVVQVAINNDELQTGTTNLTHLLTPLLTSRFLPPSLSYGVLCISPSLVTDVLLEALRLRILSASYTWLILCPVGREALAEMTSKLTYESNVLSISPEVANSSNPSINQDSPSLCGAVNCSLERVEMLTWKSFPEHDFQKIASWGVGQGWISPPPRLLFPNVFTDFGGRLLIIGTIPASPFVNRRTVGNQTTYDGFCIDLLDTMALHLKFRYKIVESPDNKYGGPEGDGTWNGMVGMVARKEVDMGVGPYTITSAREAVVDFSRPFMEDGGGILTLKDDSDASIMAGMSTFSPGVWLSLVAMTLAAGVAFHVVVRFSPYSRLSAHDMTAYWHLWGCVMHICGSCMMQGMERQPKSLSARCVLGWWWVFTILITSTYTAMLTSVLTVDLEGSRIDTLEELAASSIKPLVLAGSVWHTLFQASEGEVYKKLAKRFDDMPTVTSEDEALKYVMTGQMAFLHDVNNVKYTYAVNCKQLYLGASIFNSNGLGLVLPEKARFKAAVNDLILRLQESGIMVQWRSRWWPVTSSCDAGSAGSVTPAKQLGLPKMAGLLVVYSGVVALSFLCFLLAICLDKTDVYKKGIRVCTQLCARKGKSYVRQPPRGQDISRSANGEGTSKSH